MDPATTHGAFSWSELMTPDPEAAARFYDALLGWTNQPSPMPQGTYFLQMIGKRPAAGIMAPPEPNLPTVWVFYITVDDVDAAAAKAVELGGTVDVPPMDIPTVGRFCGLQDPQGAFFHVIKYEPMTEESDGSCVDFADAFTTPGAFSWFSLQTTDPDAAVAFYAALLGWEVVVDQMPTGPYNTIKVDGAGVGGIMKVWQEGTPPHWGAFVTVEDADATAAAAASAGGNVLAPPSDIPSVGRFTMVQDPTGGILNYVSYLPME